MGVLAARTADNEQLLVVVQFTSGYRHTHSSHVLTLTQWFTPQYKHWTGQEDIWLVYNI